MTEAVRRRSGRRTVGAKGNSCRVNELILHRDVLNLSRDSDTIAEEISYRTTSDGFEVRGTVRSRFHNGRIRGHVDIAFIDANGETLKSERSKLQRTNYSNKHQHRVTFKVLFNELPVGATILRVSHHIGSKGE